MKTMSLALVLAFSMTALGQAPQARPAAPSAAKVSVGGRVVSSTGGTPLRKASVGLVRAEAPGGAQSTTTDEQGQFVFKDVDPGRYRVWVIRTGYVRQQYGQRDPGSSGDSGGTLLIVSPGRDVKDLLFRLVPACAISGRVSDQDGEPVMGASVEALRWSLSRGRRQLVSTGTSQTDDRGEYRIFNLPPGRYYLRATEREARGVLADAVEFDNGRDARALLDAETRTVLVGASANSQAVEETYAPNFYPGTNDPTQASPLEVRGGNDLQQANFTMVPQRAVRVSGRVFNSLTGQPGRGANVHLMPSTLAMRGYLAGEQDTAADGQGYFKFRGVVPGSYTLVAQGSDRVSFGGIIGGVVGNTVRGSARQQIEVGSADLEGLNLVMVAGTELSGSLRIEGTGPNLRLQRMRVVLEASDDQTIGNLFTTIKPDGTFVYNSLPEDTYRVNITGIPEGGYLKSARLGNQDVLEDGFLMTHGRREQLEVVVSLNAGTVSGTAFDADHKPFAGARVVLVPEGDARKQLDLFRQVTSDQYGQFTIRSVPPGDYKLFAWDAIEPGAYLDPDFLRPYEDRGQAVRISESSQSTAEVQVSLSGQ